jgi:hypothetical protein
MRTIAIMQPSYIPWRGYFSLISQADTFVFLDNVQYTKNDWRNRNRVVTSSGQKFLTIPVQTKGFPKLIKDVKVSDKRWNIKHFKTINQNYSKSKYFEKYKSAIKELYSACSYEYLIDINYLFITKLSEIMQLKCDFVFASDIQCSNDRNQRLIDICKELKGTEYISPPASKAYIDESLFKSNDINLRFLNYDNMKTYESLYGITDKYLSVVDLIFNKGEEAKSYLLNK